jgi:hypothetical protein
MFRQMTVPLYLIAILAALGSGNRAEAQTHCSPFRAVSVVRVMPIPGMPGAFSLSGSGTGVPIGTYTQSGRIDFQLVGGAVHFFSRTVIATALGEIHTAEAGVSNGQAAVGSFRVLGGTGQYAGVTGSGAFRVVLNPNGTQTATYTGILGR